MSVFLFSEHIQPLQLLLHRNNSTDSDERISLWVSFASLCDVCRSDLQMLMFATFNLRKNFQKFPFGTVSSYHFISINKINMEMEKAPKHNKLNFCLFTVLSNMYFYLMWWKAKLRLCAKFQTSVKFQGLLGY